MNKLLWIILRFFSALLFVIAVGLWLVVPENFTLNISTSVFWLIYSIIIFYPVRKSWHHFFFSSRSKKTWGSLISSFLLLAILALVNFLAVKNDFYFDLTHQKRYTLSDLSIKAVKNLEKPLKVTVFAGLSDRQAFWRLLELYSFYKNDMKVEFIDPDQKPHLVQKYGVTRYGTMVFKSGKQQIHVLKTQEREITNALLKLARERQINVYYLSGHREVSLESEAKEGGNYLLNAIKGLGYKVDSLDLTKLHDIPRNTDAIMILGPRDDFLEHEVKLIQDYLKEGGSIFIAMAPELQEDRRDQLNKLLQKWGVIFRRDMVVDRLSVIHGIDASIPVIDKFSGQHEIIYDFQGRVLFPFSSSLELIEGEKYPMQMYPLLSTSTFPSSWGETDMESILENKIIFEEGEDYKGPLVLMAAYQEKEDVLKDNGRNRSRIVAAGSANFFINAYAAQAPNYNLFLNSLNWLVGEEQIISLDRPEIKQEPIIMSGRNTTMIFYITVVILPLVLLGAGILLYRRKKKL